MGRFRFPVTLALLLALGVSPLRAEETLPEEPPRPLIDLRHVHWQGGLAFASAGAQGQAELTLDEELTRAADDLLRDAAARAGAIVAIDLATGNVVVYTERGSAGLLRGAHAPAASVFKLVTTAALFETTKLTPREQICTVGGERGVERKHLDIPISADKRCGPLGQALGHSRNAAYAQLATRHLLRTDLIEVASRLGFNDNVPFDAAVPMGRLSVPYNDLEFARTATGFRNSTLSVLGGAYLASVIAYGGLSPRLRLIRQAGAFVAPDAPEFSGRILTTSTARRLTQMMEVTTRSGTAHHAFTDEEGHRYLGALRVAGKTGTLQPGAGAPTSSWFVGFAPAESPRIVVSVLLQNGDVWRRKAAEVARDFLRAYFAAKKSPGVTLPDALARRE
jgi:cell division protein FtsI/penicillin-binding protein 2